MPLVDPRGDRHQFDRRDAKLLQMLDDGRMRERGDGAALRLRNFRMELAEGTDVELVDQPTGRKDRLVLRHGIEGSLDNSFRHERAGVAALAPLRSQPRIVNVGPVDRDRIGVDKQFVRIKP